MHHKASSAPILLLALLFLVVPYAPSTQAEEPVDWEIVTRIRDEGLHRSQVMDTLEHLTEAIGPRLTGSPRMKAANEWTRDQLAAWGLADAHLESWGPFGRGWSFSRVSVHLLEPFEMPLIAVPEAWAPGTDGAVTGEVMRAEIESEDDFEDLRGKLAGKILLVDDPRELQDSDRPVTRRLSAEELADEVHFEIPEDREPDWRNRFRKRYKMRRALNEFLTEEGVVATLKVSSRDGNLVRVGGSGSRRADENPGVPSLVVAAEQYNRLLRLVEDAEKAAGEEESAQQDTAGPRPVVVEIDVRARFHDDDPMAYNTIAEIPGGDLADEVVLAGAHLDSWHAGTGATDNAAGSAVVMEAVRILETLGVQPRRTIRVALWAGEEQGLLGSRAYVSEHLASRPEPEDPEQRDLPEFLREDQGPLTFKPEHDRFAAYFNLDNGSGRIRGIYAQENAGVVPIFERWLAPFHDLGATVVTQKPTRGTDHLSFHRVGLPGFQFVQDPLDYFSRTHHTSADTLEHVVEADLRQASVILASFLYHAATRPEKLPRPPLPPEDAAKRP